MLNVRITLAVEVLSVHQTHDELGGLGGRIQCGEAPGDEASSTSVLRSGSACQPMHSVPNILAIAQHGARRDLYGGRGHQVSDMFDKSLTLRGRRKHIT